MDNVIIRTTTPIVILAVLGLLSRKWRILKDGDERVLSAYLFYFALPALLFINTAELNLTIETFRLFVSAIIPIFIVLAVYIVTYKIFNMARDTFFLLILSTVFGSLVFFGIPFIMFAFPTKEGESLAVLTAISISVVSIFIVMTVLELHKSGNSRAYAALKSSVKGLLKNPLIVSIVLGFTTNLLGLQIPHPFSKSLHLLGRTTSTIAIFMLGVFLYGRAYKNMWKALKLSLLRIALLPAIAYLVTGLFPLSSTERVIIILMHSMPLAVSIIVLSDRYDFHKETLASLILISSAGSIVYLNLWLLILGIH